MTNPTDDDHIPTPIDEIVTGFKSGDLSSDEAIVKLLAEIASAVWSIAADTSDIIAMAHDDDPITRMH